jgi:thiamine biosynthesis lipoprotein ApbE
MRSALIDAATLPGPLARRSWAALGTMCTVLVTSAAALDRACAAVEADLEIVDATYSRFRTDSELARLNRSAGRPAVVTPLLAEAITIALRAARLTDGAVDPTVGRTMRALGYDRDYADIAGRDRPLVVRLEAVPGWRVVEFQPAMRRVTVPRGVELDLGSVGKALAADRAAVAAYDASGSGVLVGLGGDIATAGPGPERGWPVLVTDDSAAPADGPGEVVHLSGGAMATSSTSVRRWRQDGVQRHHLVDPATGLPVISPWRTASVVADSCVDANTVATAAIIKGAGAPAWLARQGLPSRLVATDGGVMRLAGWPDETVVAS